jgi:hypothetical protein
VDKDIVMAPLDELVADLDITAHSAKDLDMRQQSGDFHGLLAEVNPEAPFIFSLGGRGGLFIYFSKKTKLF